MLPKVAVIKGGEIMMILCRVFAGLAALLAVLASDGAQALQSGTYSPVLPDTPRTTASSVELDVSFAPTPEFVVEVQPLTVEEYDDSDGMDSRFLLVDRQRDGRGDALVRYTRMVVQSPNAQIASAMSSLELPMDPAISSLQIHHARITRDGRVIDMTRDVSVDVLRQEDRLSQGYFTGQVNALVRMPGVRADDTLDIAYSIHDRNPSLNGRHSALVPLGTPVPFQNFHVRVVWPREALNERVVGPDVDLRRYVHEDSVEIVYGPGPVEAHVAEPGVPAWRFDQSSLLLSRFTSWREVADWAAPFYRPVITPEVRRVADAIRRDNPDPRDQIAEALRYTQREINYFAILLGEGGYTPITPDETLRYAEGDCKAKTLLLISILAALDINASAAIVSTSLGPGLLELPASPLLFNHVIVTLAHNGRRYWLDPTRSEQFGHLDALSQADFGYALVLDRHIMGLVDMRQTGQPPLLDVRESFDVIDVREQLAEAELEWTLSGVLADSMRAGADSAQPDALERLIAGFYSFRLVDPIQPGDFERIDDTANNRLTLRWRGQVVLQNYHRSRNRPVLAFGAHAVAMTDLSSNEKTSLEARALPYPFRARQTTEISWPDDYRHFVTDPLSTTLDTEPVYLSFAVEPGASSATLTAEMRIRDWELGAEQAEQVGDSMQWLINQGIMVVGPERRASGDRRLSSLDEADRRLLGFNLFATILRAAEQRRQNDRQAAATP